MNQVNEVKLKTLNVENLAHIEKTTSGLLRYLRKEIGELKQFIVHPHRRRSKSASWSEIFNRIIFLLLLELLFAVLVSFPIGLALEHWAGIKDTTDMHGMFFLFAGVFFAPLFEECLFRAGLRNARYLLFIGPILATLILGAWWVTLVFFVYCLVMLGIDKYLFWRDYTRGVSGRKFARGREFLRCYPLIFWFYAIAFGLIHITNFEFSGWSGLLVVFAVTSQLFGGLALGYVRLRHGLASAIFFHALFNFVLFSLAFFDF